jgi:hypothetical protein
VTKKLIPKSSKHRGIDEIRGPDSREIRENSDPDVESPSLALVCVSIKFGDEDPEDTAENLLDLPVFLGALHFSIEVLGVRAFRTTFAFSSRNRRASWSRYPEHSLPARLH